MHVHISGLDGLITVLYVIAILGALNLLMMRLAKGGNKFALAWCNIFAPTP